MQRGALRTCASSVQLPAVRVSATCAPQRSAPGSSVTTVEPTLLPCSLPPHSSCAGVGYMVAGVDRRVWAAPERLLRLIPSLQWLGSQGVCTHDRTLP